MSADKLQYVCCLLITVSSRLAIGLFFTGCQGDNVFEIIENVVDNREDAIVNELSFPSLRLHQSMAFYGDYAVFVTPVIRDLKCDIYGIQTGVLITSLTLPYGEYAIPHANASCFGDVFYTSDSCLPVLYVSSWNNGRQAFVYDISIVENHYVASLIQVIEPIHLDKDIVGEGYLDWVVDSEGGYLYTLAYHLKGTSMKEEGNYTHVTKYGLPALKEPVVFMEDTDIVDSFIVPVMTVFQDKTYYKGHIYVGAGMPSEDNLYPPRLFDIDVKIKSLKEYSIPLIGEPEGLCVYHGTKWLNMYNSSIVYNLDKLLNY